MGKRNLLQTVIGKTLFLPQTVNGSTIITGSIIDTQAMPDPHSLVVSMLTAAATGSPTAVSYAIIIQHGDAANLSDAATFVTLTAFTNATPGTPADYTAQVDVALAKRYIRLAITPTFTGGTTPAIVTAASGIFGDAKYNDPTGETATTLANGIGYTGGATVIKP